MGVVRFADTDWSNFDGLGHYRHMATGGNFGSGDVRTTFINYDAASGSYPSANYVMPSTGSAWILETRNMQNIVEGQSAQIIEFVTTAATAPSVQQGNGQRPILLALQAPMMWRAYLRRMIRDK